MPNILLLSDTHAFLDPLVAKYAAECDEIWHAGDIGALNVLDELNKIKPVRAVFGNIDDHLIRASCPENQFFECGGMKIYMTHIGGSPGKYPTAIKKNMLEHQPDIFICGHSHILKIIYDKKMELLHLNPGAIGKHGFHTVQTFLTFSIAEKKITNLKIIEQKRN